MSKDGTWARLREFWFGLFGYEVAQNALEMRAQLEALFVVVTMGDLLGIPVMPPYYSLRLLPYAVPNIQSWKRRLLRERELGDAHETHLHGL